MTKTYPAQNVERLPTGTLDLTSSPYFSEEIGANVNDIPKIPRSSAESRCPGSVLYATDFQFPFFALKLRTNFSMFVFFLKAMSSAVASWCKAALGGNGKAFTFDLHASQQEMGSRLE